MMPEPDLVLNYMGNCRLKRQAGAIASRFYLTGAFFSRNAQYNGSLA
jgi:hypothetical protein